MYAHAPQCAWFGQSHVAVSINAGILDSCSRAAVTKAERNAVELAWLWRATSRFPNAFDGASQSLVFQTELTST